MLFKQKKFIIALAINLCFLGLIFSAPVLAVSFENPLSGSATETKTIEQLYGGIVKAALGLVGSMALVFFIWGGALWMTAGGNEERVKQGRDTLIWAVLGLAAIFISYAVLSVVIRTLSGSTYT